MVIVLYLQEMLFVNQFVSIIIIKIKYEQLLSSIITQNYCWMVIMIRFKFTKYKTNQNQLDKSLDPIGQNPSYMPGYILQYPRTK